MTRAERYKRNYRLVRNVYHNTKLAKRAQTWSDERLLNELGIIVTRKTPKLNKTSNAAKTRGARLLENYKYARSQGLSVKESRKLKTYAKRRIDSSARYYKAKNAKFTTRNKETRMDLWSEWSRGVTRFPPDIEKMAREVNQNTEVSGRQLDDAAKYGYIVAFYRFVENKSFDEIKDLVQQDPHDSNRIIYPTEVRPTA